MKSNNSLHPYIPLINLLLFSAAFLAAPGLAATTNQVQDVQSSGLQRISLPQSGEYLLAQVSPSCRRVVSRSGLEVRQQPTMRSQAVGMVNYRSNVAIQNRGMNGWVPISAPLEGYVNARAIGACNLPISVPPTNCRSVVTPGGVSIRQTPSTQGKPVGFVGARRRVTVENLGANGWVPIIVPLKGYVQSANLAYCL